MRERAWLPNELIRPALPTMRALGVSEVARSRVGFLAAWARANGDPNQLTTDKVSGQLWRDRRNNFLARHLAQVEAKGEPLWVDGQPTRRHLALVAWAYTPNRTRWRTWLETL